MDNVTHSLIGATVGQAIVRSVPRLRENKRLATTVIWASVLGNNAPDLDIFQSWYLGGGTLSYLLYHRGQSHTLVLAPFIAIIVTFLSILLSGIRPARLDWFKIYAISVLSVFLHLVADFGNDYGIHPFWPFWNGWVYGGYFFIIEPWIWIVTIPVLIFAFSSRAVRAAGIGLSAALPLLMVMTRAIPFGLCVVLLAAQAAMLYLGSKSRGVRPALIGIGLTLAAFVTGSLVVRHEIATDLARAKPDETLLQIVTVPAAGNPFCWRTIAVSKDASGNFADRVGYHSLIPSVFPTATCFRTRSSEGPILYPPSAPSTDSQRWTAEFRGTTGDLRALAATNCHFAAFLRWSRVPIWSRRHTDSVVTADLRYETQPGLGFAGVDADPAKPCFEPLPPWTPPSRLIER